MKSTRSYCYIDDALCRGCRQCLTLCPMNAIRFANGKAFIDVDECAECGVCTRSRLCPHRAICAGRLAWPRMLRALFSNPLAKFKTTQVYGRGTEETKTNDSQNLYKEGEIGVIVELGRPVLGTRLYDVERVLMKFAEHGYHVPPNNPVYSLMADRSRGTLPPEIRSEKAISCLLEFIVPEHAADEVLKILQQLSAEVETVFSVCIAVRADAKGKPRFAEVFGPHLHTLPSVKVNVGMARGIVKAAS